MKLLLFIYRFFCSIKPAVIILSALIILFALGTFYESAQGRRAAQEIIYRSIYMNILIFLLALNIIAVMVDRWPWKKKHRGFLMAHFGILFIIGGSLITRLYGVDGNLRLALDETGQEIITEQATMVVYSSFDAQNLTELYRERVFFFRTPPKVEKPFIIPLGKDVLKIQDFYPVANVREQYKSLLIKSPRSGRSEKRVTARNPRSGGTAGSATLTEGAVPPTYQQASSLKGSQSAVIPPLVKNPRSGGTVPPTYQQASSLKGSQSAVIPPLVKNPRSGGVAVFFQIEGVRGNMARWIYKPAWKDRVEQTWGPARIVLSSSSSYPTLTSALTKIMQKEKPVVKNTSKNSLWLFPATEKKLKYKIEGGQNGNLREGSVLKTGWMDFRFRLIRYLPQALPDTVFTPQKKAGDQTVSAVQVHFKGEQKWMGLNSHLYFFDKDKVYIIAYVKERKQLSFSLRLKDFKINRYPGSGKSSGYESQVQLNGEKNTRLISLNKPLKKGGYTIYQSGFEEDDNGVPTASIFAINKDPGRFVKYFGSLLIVLGSLVLFWGKSLRRKKG